MAMNPEDSSKLLAACRAGSAEALGRLFELCRGYLLLVAREEQERIRLLLSAIAPRQAELLILRSQGLSYEELASTLNLNPASIGTLLSRAQQAFRKEYLGRYGKGQYGKE